MWLSLTSPRPMTPPFRTCNFGHLEIHVGQSLRTRPFVHTTANRPPSDHIKVIFSLPCLSNIFADSQVRSGPMQTIDAWGAGWHSSLVRRTLVAFWLSDNIHRT